MTHDSQKLAIKRVLATGISLTPLSALRKVGTLSLSQRVGELRREGWPIASKMIRVGRKYVSSYWIPAAKAARVRKHLGI